MKQSRRSESSTTEEPHCFYHEIALYGRLISFRRGTVLHIVEPFRSDVNPELIL